MLRGLHWQLIALIVAALVFVATLATRLPFNQNNTPPPAPPVTDTAATPVSVATLTPNPGVVLPPQTFAEEVTVFREGLVGAVQHLNPLLIHDNTAERDITALIFNGLVRTNQYGEPVPDLAEGWVISADGLEYIVTLRSDVLWQDGVPFTAADVVYTMSLLRSPDFPGAADVGAFWRTVETEQLAPDVVRFRLTQPLGSFLDKLRIGILPEHALAGTTAAQLVAHPFNLSPIGTGPYQIEQLHIDGNQQITQVDLRTAPVYRQRSEGQVGFEIDRLSFVLYSTFDDALAALRQQALEGLVAPDYRMRTPLLAAAQSVGYETHTTLAPALGVVIFNWQREETAYFREQRVRMALETGIERAPIVQRNLMNMAVLANSPLWPGSWAYDPNLQWPNYDINTARFLLETSNVARQNEATETDETAEVEATASPFILSFSILAPDHPQLISMLQEMTVQWSHLGVNVTIDAQPLESYQQRLNDSDFDAALVELSLGDSADPDVYPFWHEGQYPDGLNFGGMSDRRISELLENARREPGGINRQILYGEFQREFVERAVALPVYYPLFTYVTAADVDGVHLGFLGSPADRFMNIRQWIITP